MEDNIFIQYEPYLDWIDEQHKRMYQVFVALADTNSGTFKIPGMPLPLIHGNS